MQKFGAVKTLQKFTSIRASSYNHFWPERGLTGRQIFWAARSAELAE